MGYMPPTLTQCKGQIFTFVFFDEYINQTNIERFFNMALHNNISNPRQIHSRLLELASLFHLQFYIKCVTSKPILEIIN